MGIHVVKDEDEAELALVIHGLQTEMFIWRNGWVLETTANEITILDEIKLLSFEPVQIHKSIAVLGHDIPQFSWLVQLWRCRPSVLFVHAK